MDVQYFPDPDTALYKKVEEEFDQIAQEAGLPCGFPLSVLLSKEIYLDPAYVDALLESVGRESELVDSSESEDDEWVFHRAWTLSRPWRGQWGFVEIWRNRRTGMFEKDFHERDPWVSRLNFTTRTVAAHLAYGNMEAELKARQKLEGMLSVKQMKSWVLTESFYEKGRSGMVYFLRKNRPTIACRTDSTSKEDGGVIPICALCLHAIGGISNSGAGVLPPSDDLITHLAMIRANEHLFWRKANQFRMNSWFLS